jgi:hypothetical protein
MFRSFDFFKPLPSGAKLMSRRKLPFIPHKIEGINEIRKIFEKIYGETNKNERKE